MDNQRQHKHEIERLSWLVISRLVKEIDEPLTVVQTHPGGGQYDCLGLATRDAEIRINLNRNGQSASGSAGHLENIWEIAALSPEMCSTRILVDMEFSVTDDPSLEAQYCSQASFAFAEHLKNQDTSIEWAWIDTPYEVGPREELLNGFEIPVEWMRVDAQTRFSDWRGWIWVVRVGNASHSMYNLKTGQVLFPGSGNYMIPIWDSIASLLIEREFHA